MAIPTFVASGTTAAGAGSVTPGLPAGISANTILVLHIEGEGEDTNADAPPTSGEWTAIDGATGSVASGTGGQAPQTRNSLYWHRYDGSTDPDRVVPDAGQHTSALITAWDGCVTTGSPVHQTQSTTDGSSDTNGSAAGVTTTVDDCLIVIAATTGAQSSTSAFTNADLSSLTEHVDFNHAVGSDGSIHVASGGLATAGASGTTTWTVTASLEASWVFALEPAGGGGGGRIMSSLAGAGGLAGLGGIAGAGGGLAG